MGKTVSASIKGVECNMTGEKLDRPEPEETADERGDKITNDRQMISAEMEKVRKLLRRKDALLGFPATET